VEVYYCGIFQLTPPLVNDTLMSSARRTGDSSPMGLIFDHGIDAINSIFGSSNWICAMGLSPLIVEQRWQIYFAVFCPMISFFITTWDHYHTGKMILPPFNGPTEGLLLGASLNLMTWWYGRELWHGTQMYDTLVLSWLPSVLGDYFPETAVLNYNVVIYASVLATAREAFDRIGHVVGRYGYWSLEQLIPAFLLSIGSISIIHSDLFPRNPRTCLHLFAILFVDMVTSLMLDHCTHMKYNPYRRMLAPFVIFSICVYADLGMEDPVKIDQILLSYTVGSFVCLCMRLRLIVHELSHVLRIWCFDIVTPYSCIDKKE